MSEVAADAHAKVNLALAVTGVRDDGYHLLRSVFLRLALHDRLTVAVAAGAKADSLEVDGASQVRDDDLVLRAARALRAAIDPDLPSLRFRLRKRIPVAAGLGGGSSDAAAAVDLALTAWGVRLDPARRLDAGLRLGADVPFFAAGHAAAVVEGIGEYIVPLPPAEPPAGVVLVTPPQRLSTAAVFAEYDRAPCRDALLRTEELAGAMRERIDGLALAAASTRLAEANDLWPAATRLSPGLAPARAAMSSILGRAVLMTGSGPTLVAVYPSEAAATRAAVTLQANAPAELDGAEIMTTSTSGRGETP